MVGGVQVVQRKEMVAKRKGRPLATTPDWGAEQVAGPQQQEAKGCSTDVHHDAEVTRLQHLQFAAAGGRSRCRDEADHETREPAASAREEEEEPPMKKWISPYYLGIQTIAGVKRLVRRISKHARLEVVPDEDISALQREGQERAGAHAAQGIGGLTYDADGIHAVVVAADGSHSLLMAGGGMPEVAADVAVTEEEAPMTMRQQEFAIHAARVADQSAPTPLPPGNQYAAPVAKRCQGSCGRVMKFAADDVTCVCAECATMGR